MRLVPEHLKPDEHVVGIPTYPEYYCYYYKYMGGRALYDIRLSDNSLNVNTFNNLSIYHYGVCIPINDTAVYKLQTSI